MAYIRLRQPAQVSLAHRRLHLFAGRHLGEEEFDRIQAYVDARLAPLLRASEPGIVYGLEVDLRHIGELGEGFVVRPGLAVNGLGQNVGLYLPLRQTWQGLIDDYLSPPLTTSPRGVYQLVLRRALSRVSEADTVEPCQRAEPDPRRDRRWETVGTVTLQRLAVTPAVLDWPKERIANYVAAGRLGKPLGETIPLGLLMIDEVAGQPQVVWFDPWPVRRPAVTDGGHLALFNQVSHAFADKVSELSALSGPELVAALTTQLQLMYLPGAGPLPVELLQQPAALPPGMPQLTWFHAGIAADMVPVRESAVSSVLAREFASGPIDLDAGSHEQIRLLLAVADGDYRPDLLDKPQADRQLEDDVYRYAMTAHMGWVDWHSQFNALFHVAQNISRTADEQAVIDGLKLPAPVDAPQAPDAFFQGLIDREMQERQTENMEALPLPYRDGIPLAPEAYQQWLEQNDGVRPAPTVPQGDGLAARYELCKLAIQDLEEDINDTRSKLEKSRDYLLLQRQQLDARTVSFAALAGGVAGDGSGLKLARWLPYTELVASAVPPANPGTGGAGGDPPTNPDPIIKTTAARASYSYVAPQAGAYYMAPSATQGAAEQLAVTNRYAQVASGYQLAGTEYGLKLDKLDIAGAASSAPVSDPSFEVQTKQFGVLGHVEPEAAEFQGAFNGITVLRDTIDDIFDAADADSLKKQVDALGTPEDPSGLDDTNKRYEGLFKNARLLVKQINLFDNRRHALERQLRSLARQLAKKREELLELSDDIIAGRRELNTLNGTRLERMGDYTVTQGLADEEWQRVEKVFLDRERVLTNLRGLYYVKVRGVSLGASLADPLPLRFGTDEDVVPGCDWTDSVDVPADLETFMDAVLEVPVAHWRSLAPLIYLLPTRARLQRLYDLRKARVTAYQSKGAQPLVNAALAQRLAGIVVQTRTVLYDFSRQPLTFQASTKQVQSAGAQVLSLQDVLTGRAGLLRVRAERLRGRLEQAVVCMLERLGELPPSVRLQWAQLAEDDALAVDNAERWPGLERAERQQFNSVRTLVELVDWWSRQLASTASSGSRSALRNLIRAALIVSAHGDPTEIVHGTVRTPPLRLRIGEVMRVSLNREALPGTRLNLLDTQQRVVGQLRVDDNDDQGAVTSVVSVQRTDITVDTRFAVVAPRLRR